MRGRIIIIVLLLIVTFCSCGVFSKMMVITQENKTYVIRHNWDLKGETVSLPKGCTLKFKGGSICNGTLIGNGTFIKMSKDAQVFNNVLLKGSFTAKKFPINAYNTNKLEYFYSFLQAFSGTDLYLTGDYSATEYLGEVDGTTPESLKIDGRGHKLTLYSFGAYKVQQCNIKNITIECSNNIDPKNKWKSDKFTFGVVGSFGSSTLVLSNVTFSKETGFAYIRGFKSLDISQCKEDGSYFFVYDCNNVSFHNNSIENADNGYYSIGKMTEAGQVKIYDNTFRNISGGGVILSGGLKYNVSITGNVLENVGGGGAMKSCINVHPRGTIVVKDNKIKANKGAVTLDVDAARAEYYSDATTVTVENNVIESVEDDASLHGMALVGIAKLYVKNNSIKNQHFYFWDTPYMEFMDNTIEFSDGFEKSTEIGSMSTHETTETKEYNHIYRNNVFNIPYTKGMVHFRYQSTVPVKVIGEGNTYSKPVEFVDHNKKFKASGDIKIYK